MPKSPNPDQTFDQTPVPSDSLGPGLAAAFGQPTEAPRSSFGGGLQPVVLPDAAGESSHIVKTQSDALPKATQAGDRYQLSGEIARGGMGAVLRGRDVDLGRDLAIKALLEKHAQRPEIARRFLEEAQIGGQLQHPGVVPVYDIGRFGERPFFTMKLVKGKTLAEVLAERKDLTSDRPRLLGIALQVSQTLAYAHAKGVIHRDLKPANIMVGSFGEVQVMDWGLAKVLASGGVADEEKASRLHQEPKDETNIKTARSAGSDGSFGTDTEAGSLLGTPAYMPPEQANGDVALMDRRADVFGLGAILCEILTGKPPYVGRSQEEVRRKAANGDLADAYSRLETSAADKELITLTRLCLSPEPMDRPKDAQAVAESLSGYLDGVQERLRTAERERAVAVVRVAEENKRRRVQLALAGAVTVLLLGAGSFAWWRSEQAQVARERDARNGEAVSALLAQTEEALKQGDAAKARLALDAARKRSTEENQVEHLERCARIEKDLVLLADLEEVDQFRWTFDGERQRYPDPRLVASQIKKGLERYGLALWGDRGDFQSVNQSLIRDRIVGALDWLNCHDRSPPVRALLRVADPDRFRDAIRDAVFENNPKRLVELANQHEAFQQPPGFTAFLGENRVIDVEKRRKLLKAALINQPGNFGLLVVLGDSYPINEREGANERSADEMLRWYQAAIASSPNNPLGYVGMGYAKSIKKDYTGSEDAYRQAVRLTPKLAKAYINLGTALSKQKKWDEAESALREAIRLSPGDPIAYVKIGTFLGQQNKLEESESALIDGLKHTPNNSLLLFTLGIVKGQKNDIKSSIVLLKKAIDNLDPDENHELGNFHYNLGLAFQKLNKFEDAINSYKNSLDINPENPRALINLGIIIQKQNKINESIKLFKKAIQIDPNLPNGYASLGIALMENGQTEEALVQIHRALELAPTNPESHYNLACATLLKIKGKENWSTKEKNQFRIQAKGSLNQALNLIKNQMKNGELSSARARAQLRHWQTDPDLASIRDPQSLKNLPPEEQKELIQLWDDVAALRKRAETPAAKEERR